MVLLSVSISRVSQNTQIFSLPAKKKFPSFSRKITRDIDSVNGREIFIENSTNEYFIFLPFSVCLSVRIIFHALPTLRILFFHRLGHNYNASTLWKTSSTITVFRREETIFLTISTHNSNFHRSSKQSFERRQILERRKRIADIFKTFENRNPLKKRGRLIFRTRNDRWYFYACSHHSLDLESPGKYSSERRNTYLGITWRLRKRDRLWRESVIYWKPQLDLRRFVSPRKCSSHEASIQ